MDPAPPFLVQPWLEAHATPHFVPVVRPRPIGCWSKLSSTQGGQYRYGSLSGLSAYQQPALPQSLDEGFLHAYIKKDDGECTPVEVVIRGLKQSGADVSRVAICTFRNNLNKILSTPLNPNDAWTIDACYHSGTMFLDIVKTPQKDFPDSDRFTFYGYKFEALCSGGGANGIVDATSEFALLLKLRLGSHDIVLAAEVDCCRADDAGQPCSTLPAATDCFLELKTAKLHNNPKQRERHLAQKYPKWWVQSFLASVPTIVVGARDDHGRLTQVFELPVAGLPSAAAAAGVPFNAWQLLQFGDAVLTMMTETCQVHPEEHVRFEYAPAQRSIHGRVLQGGPLPARLRQEIGDGSPDGGAREGGAA